MIPVTTLSERLSHTKVESESHRCKSLLMVIIILPSRCLSVAAGSESASVFRI